MNTKKEIMPLFPKPVLKTSMDRPFTEEEKTYMLSQVMEASVGNSSSKNRRILNSPELAGLKQIAQELLDFWTSEMLLVSPEAKLEITQSWMNSTKPGQHHHNHYHPNSIVSGVFYIDAQKERDQIMLLDPTPSQFRVNFKANNIFNSEEFCVSVETGSIVLFPSLMYHGVPPLQSGNTRISLAFNSFWKGTLGFANDSTNYLEINNIK